MKDALRINVVAACPFPYPRGTPIRAVRSAEALARRGHDVHVATYHVGRGRVAGAVKVHRIRAPAGIRPVEPGPTAGKLLVLDPLLLRETRRVLTAVGPFDVVHAHHYEGLLIALAATRRTARRIPVVYDAHTALETELPSYAVLTRGRAQARLGAFLDRRLPCLADHIVSVSSPLRDRLVGSGAVREEHVSVVPNGVEAGMFRPREGRPLPEAGRGTVVYAGNLAAYHRVDLLLEAFAAVAARRPGAKLSILTESPARPVLERARALGISGRLEVRAVPFRALPDALAEADIAVNPRPVCDGLPQKNLNYMAAGLPIVAFAGSLQPCRDGETGVAAVPVAGWALAAAILRLLDSPDLAARLGAAARSLAAASFSWESAARRLEEIYRAAGAPTSGGIDSPSKRSGSGEPSQRKTVGRRSTASRG